MYKPVYTNRFKKDVQAAIKRGKKLDKLTTVIEILCSGASLPVQYRDHSLSGAYTGFRDCHVEPDWILIYRMERHHLQLICTRIGSHSDLF